MREDSYGPALAEDLVRRIGGQVTKISDRTQLGRPDYVHVHNGITCFIETKIGKKWSRENGGMISCVPWDVVIGSEDGLRQFEVCRRVSKHALVMYACYFPDLKMAWVLTVNQLAQMRNGTRLSEGEFFVRGHGVEVICAFEVLNHSNIINKQEYQQL